MARLRSLRGRLFLVLLGIGLVPTALTLASGAFLLREFVATTGTAGAWDQVAESGRSLLDAAAEVSDPTPELTRAAEVHRQDLAESVRLSHLYAFLAERLLFLLPLFMIGVLALVASLALATAGWLSRSFSRPVEELVNWTHRIGEGEELPPPTRRDATESMWEFVTLREALRDTASTLEEARVREAERIRNRSWSEMARKVAHEIKNPLSPMAMAARMVSESGDPRLADAGKVLQEEIQRLDSLARSFAQFGKPSEGPAAAVDLSSLLAALARQLSTEALPIELEMPAEPVLVTGHLNALERVMRNLIVNAQDAVASRGSPSIPDGTGADEKRSGTPGEIHVTLLASEDHAEIVVADSGPGIRDDVLPKIWEPEFTTKRRGTGLGLALVRQAILAHDGTVGARNRPEGGAEFRVRIPLDPPEDSSDATPGADSTPGGGSLP